MGRWQRYWFADGGRLAAAVLRIAIASAVALSLVRLGRAVHLDAGEPYRPVGPWMVAGHNAPPAIVVTALWVIAWAATTCMLVGLATRAATAASCAAGIALAALSFSATKTWSHQYNVVFLAQLALIGARCGDTLSLDALVRRARGRPPIDEPRAYQWSVRLVQLAVALMFAGAAFHKLVHGHGTLRWALSDNLRNQLLVAFDLADLPRPAAADWLIDDPWRFRTAALLNLVAQATPLVACFAVRRPIVRAVCGAVFIAETIALGVVIDLWNPQWLPLAAAFVDWDALLRRSPAPTGPAPADWRPPRARRNFVAAFVAYDAVTAFVPGLDQQLNTYPFSGFPMFASVRARAPYDEHLAYTVPGDHAEVIADAPIDPPTQRWFDHVFRRVHEVRDPNDLRRQLATIVARAKRRYPKLGIHGVRWYLAIFEAPAVPAPARFDMHPIAILGEFRDDGTFRTALGALADDGRVDASRGDPDLAGARLVYYRDDLPTPIALPPSGEPEGDPIYVVAIARDGAPWLVTRGRAPRAPPATAPPP